MLSARIQRLHAAIRVSSFVVCLSSIVFSESGKGNCLRDPAVGVASHDHLRDGRLPGQRFTADQQCSYFWGREYQVEIPNGRAFDDICRILWCGNAGSTISTAHPALEGSWCGNQKVADMMRIVHISFLVVSRGSLQGMGTKHASACCCRWKLVCMDIW